MKKDLITIAIPLLNETQGVYELVQKTLAISLNTEIIIIDDGSTNKKTLLLLSQIKKQYNNIKILRNKRNIGKASSIQKALKRAKGNLFIILDGDSELDPEDIPRLYYKLTQNKAQLINGTRIFRGTIKQASLSNFLSRLAKKLTSLLIHVLYGKKIKDPLSGLKLFYTEDFKQYIFFSKKFGLEVELITESINRNYKIEEADVNYYPRSYKEGKKIQIFDGLEITTTIFSKLRLGVFLGQSQLLVVLLAFLAWFIPFSIYNLPSNASPTTDTIPNTFTAVNITYNKRLDLTNFKPYFVKRGILSYVTTTNSQNQLYAKTPVINGILSAPFIYFFDKKYDIKSVTVEDFLQKDFESYYQLIGKQYGSLLASLSTLLVFLIINSLFNRKLFAFFWSLAYALATPVYSTAAQGNWQHAPSLLLITGGYYCLFLFLRDSRRRFLLLTSILLSIATLIRVSNAIFYMNIGIILFIYGRYRKYIFNSFLIFLLPIVFWVIFLHKNNIPGGYNEEIIRSIQSINPTHILRVVFSLLISPNVGLLIFTPICIFGLLTIGKIIYEYLKNEKIRSQPIFNFLFISSFSFLGILLFNSVWWAWEGGYSWGPRLLTEGTPFLIFLGAYFMNSLTSQLFQKLSRLLFCILFVYSFFVQIVGVYAYETEWQSKYFKGNDDFTTAWFNYPSIIEFYIKRQSFHTITLQKKGNHLIIEKKYYHFNLDFQKPLSSVQEIRNYIK